LWATYLSDQNEGPNGQVGSFLGSYSPWNLPTAPNGIVQINDEFGFDVVDNDICDDGLLPGNDDENNRLRELTSTDKVSTGTYYLYNLSGQLVWKSNEDFTTRQSVIEYVKNQINLNGIYLLQSEHKGKPISEKIFIGKSY